jgi:anti-repressor protein
MNLITKDKKMINRNIRVFDNIEFGQVRTITIDNKSWFVGKDICAIFNDKNHNRSLGRIDEEDKTIAEIKDTLGRKQNAVLINESGIYTLLFNMQPQKANKANVPDAYPIEIEERIIKIRKFRRWVTSEVLPSIRKHGMYAARELLDDPDLLISMLENLKAEQKKAKMLENNDSRANTQCRTISYFFKDIEEVECAST